ncbi:MAG: GGDEF domain-containing protein [Desulfuromonas thiophila]|nr:GGDEF domain-containing protein [Desulfuromonas thiophila]
MSEQEVLDYVLACDELPTLSTVASRLISMAAEEDTTISDIAGLISKDISLSTKILRVVNSSFYSFPQQIGTIHQAASILGTNAVRSLVLSFTFLKPDQMRGSGFDYATFWEKSLFEAVAARMLMTAIGAEDSEEGFVAGLLQNLGILILARAFPEKYPLVEQRISEQQQDRCAAELDIIGADHTFIGSEVVKRWGFPEALILPLRYHHEPHRCKTTSSTLRQLCNLVYLAGLLAEVRDADKPDEALGFFKKQVRLKLNLQEKILERFLEQVHTEVEDTAKFFDLKISPQKSIAEILQIANAKLSVLNLTYEQMNRALIEKTVQLEMLTKELEKKNALLERLAHIDGLTEAYNHRYFQNQLDREIKRADRNEDVLSLVMVDIDHFKKFNDNHGHQAGDQVLRQFCDLCRSTIREYDLFARYGGEEFVIVLPQTDAETANEVAEKLRSVIASHSFSIEREHYHLTASFGVADLKPVRDGFGKNELISRADEALYAAKKKGRNNVVVYSQKKKWFGRTP